MASERRVDKNPRLIGKGDVVRPKGRRTDLVVRDVSIILHMADGTDVVYGFGELADFNPNPEPELEELRLELEGS